MRVSVIGTGYVGLVTGACLAHIGHDVVCVDNNVEKVATLQTGKPYKQVNRPFMSLASQILCARNGCRLPPTWPLA